MNKLYTLVLVLFIVSCKTTEQSTVNAQSSLKQDERTVEFIDLGKKYLKTNSYDDAIKAFEMARKREFNRASTAAIYLTGLAYFYKNDKTNALRFFDRIINEFPKSRYVDEAKYHKGILQAKSENLGEKERGLSLLLNLNQEAKESEMRNEAMNSVKHYLFYESRISFLQGYYPKIPLAQRLPVVEALCYQMVEKGRRDDAKKYVARFKKEGGIASPFLVSLFDERRVEKFRSRDIIKVGVFLPLHLDDYSFDTTYVPLPKGKASLEFYEGLKEAIEEYSSIVKKKVYVKVFDTDRSLYTIEQQLREMDQVYPDVVIGEVYNKESAIISRWAEQRGIPQMIVMNPTPSLVANKSHTFLARPSFMTHGKKMAEYAALDLNLKRVAVFTDERRITNQIAETFITTFDTIGGEVIRLTVDSLYDEKYSPKKIEGLVRSLGAQDVDGVYIPLSNEETAGLILSYIGQKNLDLTVMGTPHWQYFKVIDRDDKERVGLYFSSATNPEKESPQYLSYYNRHLMNYEQPPSTYNIQGYDVGAFLLETLNAYDPKVSNMSLSQYLRGIARYEGAQNNFIFFDEQVNQGIHICQYNSNRIIKVNK